MSDDYLDELVDAREALQDVVREANSVRVKLQTAEVVIASLRRELEDREADVKALTGVAAAYYSTDDKLETIVRLETQLADVTGERDEYDTDRYEATRKLLESQARVREIEAERDAAEPQAPEAQEDEPDDCLSCKQPPGIMINGRTGRWRVGCAGPKTGWLLTRAEAVSAWNLADVACYAPQEGEDDA